VSAEDVREKAEKRFEYWTRIGKPLLRMSQRYGAGILLVLPKELTETSLHALRKGRDQDVVDYINLWHPKLKEQISNLSPLLPGIIAGGPPSNWLVIETIPHNELDCYSLEALFQFSNYRESPELGDLPSEEPSQPSQMPMKTVDARQVDAAVGPSDRGHANDQPSYAQGIIESVQSMRPDRASVSLQSRSPSAEVGDGSLSNSTTDYSEYTRPSACHEKSDYHKELDQEFSMEDPSFFQDNDQYAQPHPGHSGGFPNPQDYYFQGVDWRAQLPSACEGEFLDSQDSDLQRSGPSEAECSDLDSFINYSPKNLPNIASTSPSQSPRSEFTSAPCGYAASLNAAAIPSTSTDYSTRATEPDINSPALIDTWQNESMTIG
jgi:hypothetical protein